MDILKGKTIGDFSKPQNLTSSMRLEFGPKARIRHWSVQNIRVMRAMMALKVRLGQERTDR